MDLSTYQSFCESTAVYPQICALEYLGLGLCSEAGEVAGKIKKRLRDGNIEDGDIISELSDVLWYVSEMARQLGYPLETVFEVNVRKLQSRKDRGTLQGSGDNR